MRFTHISDTHCKYEYLDLPKADMIIHSGDFSHNSVTFYEFIDWYAS